MDTLGPEAVMTTENLAAQEKLAQLFTLKAEWLKEKLFEFFTAPSYLPDLTTSHPCMLIGGRGTGKTTVLRCMSYQGQFALSGRDVTAIRSWSYIGLYMRVNTNRVTAFKGSELSEERWVRTFAHYLNLNLCELILQFSDWYASLVPSDRPLAASDCARVARSLNVGDASDPSELLSELSNAKIEFEAYINSVADEPPPRLSMQGAPVDLLVGALKRLPQFENKNVFFLIDEYENFENYQMRVVNTLIKHVSADLYSFKVGVRELGLRCRTTLNLHEQLVSPADYERVNIHERLTGRQFKEFALRVCDERLSKLYSDNVTTTTQTTLPGLSEEREAELLDSRGEGIAQSAALALQAELGEEPVGLTLLEKYFIVWWANNEGRPLLDAWRAFKEDPVAADTRFQNYKHALLYTLYRKRRGIRKYYAGWDQYVQIAGGNIRYFLELVDQALLFHLESGSDLYEPVTIETQTKAAQFVGQKNLAELEGLSEYGAQLTKLLLGLGRVFQTMAAQLAGHAPEVNQFHVAESGDNDVVESRVDALLGAAVMHLALVRVLGSKPGDVGDTREYDYMIHPIFAPFFVVSFRRKRKMIMRGEQIMGLVDRPKETIRDILVSQNRTEDEPLPDQYFLFEGYYRATS
jgi:hypothetical protein